MARFTKKNPFDFDEVIVNGCSIKPNTRYEIVHREPVDGTAPEEYFQLKSCKEKYLDVSNTMSLSQFNSGFRSDSDNFNNELAIRDDWGAREKKAELLFKTFAEPLRSYIPEIDRAKLINDNEFYDYAYKTGYFTVNIKDGLVLDTSNPLDRFKLYIAIIENQLVMKGKRKEDELAIGLADERDPRKLDAQFAYVSITDRKATEDIRAHEQMEMSHKFIVLLNSNLELLVRMLKYINVSVSDKSTKIELTSTFKNNVLENRQKFEDFQRLYNRYENDKEELVRELDVLHLLNKTSVTKKVLVKEGHTYFMGERSLGSNLKSVAKSLIDDEELYTQFMFKAKD